MPLPPKREGPPKQLAEPGDNVVKFVNAWVMQGRVVFCGHCDGITFTARKLLMNTRGMTYMGLDWLNETSVALVCDHCTHIEWFTRAPHQEPVQAHLVIRPAR